MTTAKLLSLKLTFWSILGALSVFFAEVVSCSDMFPFFSVWGILVTLPLYTLHVLVLSHVVFTWGRPWFYPLFAAGALFGMYEAYITKVLWNPPWESRFFSLGGIAVVESVVLVLFWHPFMSFIIPLFVGENLLTDSREIARGLPAGIRKAFATERKTTVTCTRFATFMGLYQIASSPSPLHSFLSGVSALGILLGLVLLWRKISRGKKLLFRDLLPGRGGFIASLSLLLILYLVLGFQMRPEALPGPAAQAWVWLMYAVLSTLLFATLQRSKEMPRPETSGNLPQIPLQGWLRPALVFLAVSSLGKLLLAPLGGVVMLSTWLLGVVIGVSMLLNMTRFLIRGRTGIL